MEALENCFADTKCALVMLVMCDQASKSNLEWNSGNMCFNGTTKRWHFIHLETFTARSMLFEQAAQSVKAAIAGHQDDVARTSSPSIHGVDIDDGSTDAAQTPLGHRAASSCKSTRSGLDANPGKVLSLSHTQLCHAPVPHTHNFVSHNFHTRHDSFTYNS